MARFQSEDPSKKLTDSTMVCNFQKLYYGYCDKFDCHCTCIALPWLHKEGLCWLCLCEFSHQHMHVIVHCTCTCTCTLHTCVRVLKVYASKLPNASWLPLGASGMLCGECQYFPLSRALHKHYLIGLPPADCCMPLHVKVFSPRKTS